MLASRANYVAVGCELKWDYGVTPSRLRYSGFPGKSGFGHRNSIRKGSAKATCNSKAKMSALSKVGMSVFYLLVVRFGGYGSDECGADEQARADDVLARLDGRGLTTLAAADLRRVILRQTHRLLKRYRAGGAPANRRRGRPSNFGKPSALPWCRLQPFTAFCDMRASHLDIGY